MASRMKELYNQVVFERRVLFGCTILVGLSTCIWAVAIGTDHWFIINAPEGTSLPLGDAGIPGRRLIHKHTGLWRSCINGLVPENSKKDNNTSIHANNTNGPNVTFVSYEECKSHDMFPSELKIRLDPGLNDQVLSYSRTQVSFAMMSLLVMIMGFCFSIYTFRNPRYMFKRLAGGIHFITAACNMVVIQVFLSSIQYESKYVPETFPEGAIMKYDYSLILAWIVFLSNLLSGCAFMLFSRKRKRDKAPTEEIAMADEPTIIGR